MAYVHVYILHDRLDRFQFARPIQILDQILDGGQIDFHNTPLGMWHNL